MCFAFRDQVAMNRSADELDAAEALLSMCMCMCSTSSSETMCATPEEAEEEFLPLPPFLSFDYEKCAIYVEDILAFLESPQWVEPVSQVKTKKVWSEVKNILDRADVFIALMYNLSRDWDRICPRCMRWGWYHINSTLIDDLRWERSGTCSQECENKLTAYLCFKAMDWGLKPLDTFMELVWERVERGMALECIEIWKACGTNPIPTNDIKQSYSKMALQFQQSDHLQECLKSHIISKDVVNTDFNRFIIDVTANIIIRQNPPKPREPKTSSVTRSSVKYQPPRLKITPEEKSAPIRIFIVNFNTPNPPGTKVLAYIERVRTILLSCAFDPLQSAQIIRKQARDSADCAVARLLNGILNNIEKDLPATEFQSNIILHSIRKSGIVSGSDALIIVWGKVLQKFLKDVTSIKLPTRHSSFDGVIEHARDYMRSEMLEEAKDCKLAPMDKVLIVCDHISHSFIIDESILDLLRGHIADKPDLLKLATNEDYGEESHSARQILFCVFFRIKEPALKEFWLAIDSDNDICEAPELYQEEYDEFAFEDHDQDKIPIFDTLTGIIPTLALPSAGLGVRIAAAARIEYSIETPRFQVLKDAYKAVNDARKPKEKGTRDLVLRCGVEMMSKEFTRFAGPLASEMRQYVEELGMRDQMKDLARRRRTQLTNYLCYIKKKKTKDDPEMIKHLNWLENEFLPEAWASNEREGLEEAEEAVPIGPDALDAFTQREGSEDGEIVVEHVEEAAVPIVPDALDDDPLPSYTF